MASQQCGARTRPLGDLLLASGYIDPSELQMAMAYKMGYPMVDLKRFEPEIQALKQLPVGVLKEHRFLPLLDDGRQLIVAVDDLRRIPALQEIKSLTGRRVAAVLAPRVAIALALDALVNRNDVWGTNVPRRSFFATRH